MEVAGQRHDQRHLHQLRRLQLDDAEIEPALGALVDLAQHVDGSQHGQDRAVEQVGQAEPDPQVDQGHGHHDRQADRQPHAVLPGPGRVRAAAGRVEHGVADQPDHQQQRHQRPVQLPQLLAQRQLGRAQPRRGRGDHDAAPCFARGHGRGRRRQSSSKALRMMSRAIGAAALEPLLAVLDDHRHGDSAAAA